MQFRKNVFWALPLIAVGVVWQLKNMGIITYDLFHLIISWQMLLMYIGLYSIFCRRIVGGLVTFLAGAWFLMLQIGWLENDWFHVYWPLALIVAGVAMLFKPRRDSGHHWKQHHRDFRKEGSCVGKDCFINTDGYVESGNIFGSVQQIILDPVFKGAKLKVLFGGTVLDLRHTKLEGKETFIEIDCTFGGIEICVPPNWNLNFQVHPIMGSCEDKRFNHTIEIDSEHQLIVRGDITFGGLEIKN